MDNSSLNLASLVSDPDVFKALQQIIGVRYTTTQPTHTPNKEVEIWIYKDGTPAYWIYVWVDGAWRKVQIT